MTELQLPKHIGIVRSNKGQEILRQLLQLAKDELWWENATSEDIHLKIKSIVGGVVKGDIQPRYCTSHTHRKAESFMIYQVYLTIMRYYQSSKVESAHSLILHEHFNIFNVRTFSVSELEQHIQTHRNVGWW